MINTKLVQAYKEQANITDDEHAKSALKIAYEQRTFEIDNYWKRASYLWTHQVIFVTAAAFGFKDGEAINIMFLLMVSILGAISSLTAVLMAKGSKFWIENWEGHIEILEAIVGRSVYNISVLKGTSGYSLSHLNYRLLQVMFGGWIIPFTMCLLYTFNELYPHKLIEGLQHSVVFIAPVLLALGIFWVSNGKSFVCRAGNFPRILQHGQIGLRLNAFGGL